MESREEIIKSINIDRANLEYIAVSGKINGSLFVSLNKAMQEYADQQTKALTDEIDYMKHTLENDVIHINKLQSRISELEKGNEWISVDIEPEFGGEYNVVYDLEDGEPELVVTTLMYCKLEKTWRDERGANYIVNTVKLWRELPNNPKTN